MRELEEKAEELLNGQDAGETTETGGNEEKKKAEKKTITDPGEALKEISRGRLKLLQSFRAHGEDVEEVEFDFCALTSEEMLDALDSVPVNNMLAITNAQALALFAATAGKCAPGIDGDRNRRLYDATDVKKRMSAQDAIKAIQIAKLFYHASSQAGSNNISKK